MISKTQPTDFKKEVDVVGCFIEYDGKFILLLRQPHKKSGGTWGLPAGKVDAGETIHRAMVREVQEETGLQIPENELQYFDSYYVRNQGHDIMWHVFFVNLAEKPEVKINPAEHQNFSWKTPKEALQMDLVHDQDEFIKIFHSI